MQEGTVRLSSPSVGGGGGGDGMDVLPPLLEVWRTPFVRVRQGALQMRHLCGLDTVKTGISTCCGE
jgi:hypothetical protein